MSMLGPRAKGERWGVLKKTARPQEQGPRPQYTPNPNDAVLFIHVRPRQPGRPRDQIAGAPAKLR